MPQPLRILVVDDAQEYGRMVAEFIRSLDSTASVDVTATVEDTLRAFDHTTYDVAFFDYWLGSDDGLTLLREVRRRRIDTPVVIMTGRGAEEVAVEAMKAGAVDYLSKTLVTPENLGAAIRHAVALNTTERRRRETETALRASEGRFRSLVENSFETLLLTDRNGRLSYVTPSSAKHLGREPSQLIGRSIFDIVHHEDREMLGVRITEALGRPGEPVGFELRFQHGQGDWRRMELVAANRLEEPAVGAIVIHARDVTERRRLEERLHQSQKMEAIGRLAGGIAHDFNNLLTAILGYCNLMMEDRVLDESARQDLEEIRAAGERAADLTRQLLAFGRRQVLQPQIVDVNDRVVQLQKMLRRLIGEDIELVTALADEVSPIRVDPASFEQILVNLAVNARDAMPLGGRLTVETANVELDEAYAQTRLAAIPGRYLLLAVSDTGQGMDASTTERIFEPFFTTKASGHGRGTGLGLATVYGIVKQSGGYIWVYSEPNHGTVFKVYFPIVSEVQDDAAVPKGRDSKARGWETVLLVEDEDAVRVLAREILRRQGYNVLEARHGLDALRVAERHADTIHLLVTDLVMPHMSGRDLADRLVEIRSDLKVLFISGYTDHAVLHRELTPGMAFLQKPFTPDAFAKKVRATLNGDKAADLS
jgi:PAS domain S-box-containing protein